LDTNVKSIIYALKYQLPAIGKSSNKDDWGVIINNSSVVSTRVKASLGGAGTYAATKSAVDTLTRFGALEGAALHVRVNAVNPGVTASEGVGVLFGGSDDKIHAAAESMGTLVSHVLSTDELARFVLFVADNTTGRFFNGSTLNIDGGVGVQ
jgi:NAD(P)-dependent dehydrogenase (short-subunit alcohol dehydrogenase family)